ncbi:hypothetical protein J6590_049372 [Homalodisca vitripennis]|nr:hypothetical protein J6590_049372 [Homalodisca vitripennis]
MAQISLQLGQAICAGRPGVCLLLSDMCSSPSSLPLRSRLCAASCRITTLLVGILFDYRLGRLTVQTWVSWDNPGYYPEVDTYPRKESGWRYAVVISALLSPLTMYSAAVSSSLQLSFQFQAQFSHSFQWSPCNASSNFCPGIRSNGLIHAISSSSPDIPSNGLIVAPVLVPVQSSFQRSLLSR